MGTNRATNSGATHTCLIFSHINTFQQPAFIPLYTTAYGLFIFSVKSTICIDPGFEKVEFR